MGCQGHCDVFDLLVMTSIFMQIQNQLSVTLMLHMSTIATPDLGSEQLPFVSIKGLQLCSCSVLQQFAMIYLILSYGYKYRWARTVDQWGPSRPMDLLKQLDRNPEDVKHLYHLRGWDDKVMTQVFNQGGAAQMLQEGLHLLSEFGVAKYRCKSGHHRSIALAEVLGNWARHLLPGSAVRVVHMACHLDGELGISEHYDFQNLWHRITTDPEGLSDLQLNVTNTFRNPLGLHLATDRKGQCGLFPRQMQELMQIWGDFSEGLNEELKQSKSEEELFSRSAVDPEEEQVELEQSQSNEDWPFPEAS